MGIARIHRRFRPLLGSLSATILAASVIAIPVAADAREEQQARVAQPTEPVHIIDPATWIPASAGLHVPNVDGAIIEGFYPTGRLAADTVVVMPDYLEAVGLEYEDVRNVTTRAEFERAIEKANGPSALAGGCGSFEYFTAPVGGAWGSTHTHSCLIWGSYGATVSYQWTLSPGTNQHGCARGRGFLYSQNGPGTWGYTSLMYGIGCVGSGGGSAGATVDWGNVAASKQIKGRSTNILHMMTGAYR